MTVKIGDQVRVSFIGEIVRIEKGNYGLELKIFAPYTKDKTSLLAFVDEQSIIPMDELNGKE